MILTFHGVVEAEVISRVMIIVIIVTQGVHQITVSNRYTLFFGPMWSIAILLNNMYNLEKVLFLAFY